MASIGVSYSVILCGCVKDMVLDSFGVGSTLMKGEFQTSSSNGNYDYIQGVGWWNNLAMTRSVRRTQLLPM